MSSTSLHSRHRVFYSFAPLPCQSLLLSVSSVNLALDSPKLSIKWRGWVLVTSISSKSSANCLTERNIKTPSSPIWVKYILKMSYKLMFTTTTKPRRLSESERLALYVRLFMFMSDNELSWLSY